ncbi:MAG: tRNA pseudouridine(38-40) synthase TruA, partial [Planctomycetota bacterium]|nr:tRNA pseudouridine(38-40) synthase TruA [Planctomycetota bacterium]
MPRHKLIVAYDGTAFHGWQKQHPPEREPLRTVQGVLEDAISQVLRAPVSVLGASRTDAGVHARGQVAAFNADTDIAPGRMMMAINSRLPDDVQLRDAAIVDDAFNPIGDAVAKGYRYRIAHSTVSGGRRPLFDRHITAFTPYVLDPARMNEAARVLIGEHDFASFTRLHHGRESTVRTVYDCQVNVTSRHRLRIDVCGDGFLYNMVRVMAGTLLEVGRGRIEPEAMEEILAARDRSAAGPTMPPEGLCLMWVRYPPPESPLAPPPRGPAARRPPPPPPRGAKTK